MTIRDGVTNFLDRINNSDLSRREKQGFFKQARERLGGILEERERGGGEDTTAKLRKLSQRIDNAAQDGGLAPRQAAKLQERIQNVLDGDDPTRERAVRPEREERPERIRRPERKRRRPRPDREVDVRERSERPSRELEERVEARASRLITRA